MTDKRQVRLRIISEQDHETTEHHADAVLYRKPGAIYLRYNEPEGSMGGPVTTTVKADSADLKLIRRGAVESEQLFAAGRTLAGYYRSPHIDFPMKTYTYSLDIHWSHLDGGKADGGVERLPLSGTIRWKYDLYANDEYIGQFAIVLDIQEEINE